jgi:hypothetical protein
LYTIAIPDDKRQAIANLLAEPASELPGTAYLTVFDDRSSPRPGVADVWFTDVPPPPAGARGFHPAALAVAADPRPRISSLTLALVLALLAVAAVVVMRWRRRRRAGMRA